MAFQKDKPGYYMPLSSSSLKDGLVGPAKSVFSNHPIQYSKETQDFVKLLMKESNLTCNQKHGFQSILRSGKSLPERPTELAERKREFLNRRAAKGRALGLNLHSSNSEALSVHALRSLVPGGRRSLDSIKASGCLEPTNYKRTYIPFNQELEKARLAYKMAYGRYPNHTPVNTPRKAESRRIQKEEKSIAELRNERFAELIEEVKDRADFLKSMVKIRREKNYLRDISFQIKEKVTEMRTLCPLETAEALGRLRLDEVDSSLATL